MTRRSLAIALFLLLARTSFADERVVVVTEASDGDFFADEDAEIRAAVSTWLAEHTDRKVAPAAQVESQRRRALAGQDATTGLQCGAPQHAHDGYRQAFGEYDSASIRIPCEKSSCRLQVIIYGKKGAATYFAAPLAGSITKASVLAAVPHLEAAAPPQARGGGGVGGLLGGVLGEQGPAREHAQLKLTVWGELPKNIFAAAQPALQACVHPGRMQEMFVVSVDAKGKIDRCEGRPWDIAQSKDCVCDALSAIKLPPKLAGRRIGFDVVHEARDVAVDGKPLSAFFSNSYELRITNAPSVTWSALYCLEKNPPSAPLKIPLTWRVRPDATIERVDVDWPADRLSSEQQACVAKTLLDAKFMCARPGDASARKTELTIQPRRSLSDVLKKSPSRGATRP